MYQLIISLDHVTHYVNDLGDNVTAAVTIINISNDLIIQQHSSIKFCNTIRAKSLMMFCVIGTNNKSIECNNMMDWCV